jgi:hypothetical protein
VRGIVKVYCVEDSEAGEPEDRTGCKMCFRDQGYVDFVRIEESLELQSMR